MSLTKEQLGAVQARGNVLVSASAGAGKTSVMIKRLADILEKGGDLDSVLAVTFTKKAAAQMKERLRGELISRLADAQNANREHLRLQLGKINSADICTIHSFCTRLVRTYSYVAGIDSSFDVLADSAEEESLRRRVMDDLFEKLYCEKDENLYTLLEKLRKKRSDSYLKRLLSEAYDRVRINANYRKTLIESLSFYSGEGFKKITGEYEEEIKARCKLLLEQTENFAKGFAPAANAEGYFKVLGELSESLALFIERGSIFDAPASLAKSQKPRVKKETAECDAQFASFVNLIKARYKRIISDFGTVEEEEEKFVKSAPLARAFTTLLLAFDTAYEGVKREESKLDFADLEHYAHALLKGDKCDKDVKERISSSYKYVFVDEYQDVNPIQDEIISAVAASDIFCVGDIKQAIYGFRGSRSHFFGEKSKNMGENGKYIVLPDNFRSAPAVIEFVNSLFGKIMNKPLCRFSYGSGHAMRGGSRYPEGFSGEAKLFLYDGNSADRKAAEGIYSVAGAADRRRSDSPEGLAILKLIERALSSTIYDAEQNRERRVELGDICVLTRKRSNKSAQGIMRAISSRYPVAGAAEINVAERPEIKLITDVLKYIENAEQDVPLASALLSPLGGFNEEELAIIREQGGTGREAPPFRECVKAYPQKNGDALAQRITAFFGRVKNLRLISECVGAGKLIDELMLSGFAALFDSATKLSYLNRFRQEAYTPSGELQLSAFLYRIKRAGNKVLAATPVASDCIKVMTMHASKGLEFPVVILADISSSFSGDDRSEMPYGSMGFAPRYFNEADRSYSNTVLRRLYKMRQDREELENEINLFYVACTRAKYLLYVLAQGGTAFSETEALYADNYSSLFDINAFNPGYIGDTTGDSTVCTREEEESKDENLFNKLSAAAFRKYAFELGVELPVKSSASRLVAENRQQAFFEEEEYSPRRDEVDEGAEANVVGTAYHRFLQLADFLKTDARSIKEELVRWQLDGQITEEQRALLNVDKLVKILSMPVFREAAEKTVYREREFICRLPSWEYINIKNGANSVPAPESDDGNGVIVQGAIDMLCVDIQGGKVVGAHINDYKYSYLPDGVIAKEYAPQLALYKSVVCAIYSLPPEKVTATLININTLKTLNLQ